ncbi:MAG: TonB-dependent receptor [Verrucomicrobiota bacterium]|nr:TonB-dependent receptor [Verrucomicrobiota bacterium]
MRIGRSSIFIPARRRSPRFNLTSAFVLAHLLVVSVSQLVAQEAVRIPGSGSTEPYRSPSELKKLSLEQLVNLEITSASRRPEPILEAASAIDVLTEETIHRSGAANIPDALRLAAGLEIAQVDGHSWAISARGFLIPGANKLQVLMDGRSLYTPLFSGVFWDVQRTFMPDLEQIEVIRGPGATLWGANAVNGVINIRTKSAKDTQGWLIDAGGGNEEGYGGIRYGGQIGRDTYYRGYVMHQAHDSLSLTGGGDAQDETSFTQGGFRVDTKIGGDAVTLQGDGYSGSFAQLHEHDVEADGGNFIARWTRELGADSSISLQTYYDRTHRLVPPGFEENRDTFDVELGGRLVWAQQDIVYGANYRVSADDIANLGPTFAFIPASKTVHLISGYVQDEWHIVPGKFSLIAGSKFEHNSFSGFEVQPTGRFVFIPTKNQSFWGGISRAVRTPTRIDQDFVAPNPSTGGAAVLLANPDFASEELTAYELGYKIQPTSTLSVDVAAYYNDYDRLRSVDVTATTPPALLLANNLEGETYGGAVALRWRVTDWWHLDGSISALRVHLRAKAGSTDTSGGAGEANDPNYYGSIRSSFDLPGHLQLDAVLRYVDSLPHPATPAYTALDLRLAWSPRKNFELGIVGRNLLDPRHPEYANATAGLTHEVDRSVFATVRWTY